MISEGSCDTEDWSNDAENSDFFFFKNLKKNLTAIELLNGICSVL